jgi:hypothetical protein
MARASSRSRTMTDNAPASREEIIAPRSAPPPHRRVVACCWPIGEPGTQEFRFCDLPSEPGQAYCEEHARFAKTAIPMNSPELTPVEDPMARRLTKGFQEAARQAVQDAHAAGLAVPARADGVAVEIRPDGQVVAIDERTQWSPLDWKSSAKR